MSDEERREIRTRTHTKVLLETGVPGYLRDLSRRGCKVSLLKPASAGETLALKILPPEECGVPPFSVAVEVRWSREDPVFLQVGGLIRLPADPQARNSLERLYAWYGEASN